MKRTTSLLFLLALFTHILYSQTTNSKAGEFILMGQKALQWGYPEKANEYFQKATLADNKNAEAFYYWGVGLTAIAQRDEDEKKYKEASEKYKKATVLDPQMASAYNDWACALMQLGKITGKIKQYSSEAEKHLKKAEKLGQQMAAYNLACLYSLLTQKEKAIEWLNTMMSKDYQDEFQGISREIFDTDGDFDNIRQSNEFIQFLNSNFPNELPDKFHAI